MNFTELMTSHLPDGVEPDGGEVLGGYHTTTSGGAEDYAIGWSSDQQSLENQLSIRIIYGCISVLGIIGNFLVVFTVARVPKLQTMTNAFIVSLACCDFISAVFLIPLHLGKYIGSNVVRSYHVLP